MLERLLAQDSETLELLLANVIKHAKEAVALDVKDGNSWYNLGNAYVTSYFLTGSLDPDTIPLSLKAYQNAFKDEKMLPMPDLHFNYAFVSKYLEHYELALTGFEAAAQRDSNRNAYEEVLKIVNLLDLLASCVKGVSKGHGVVIIADYLDGVPCKYPNLSTVIIEYYGVLVVRHISTTFFCTIWLSAFFNNPGKCSLRRTTINHLSVGPNKDVAVLGQVLFFTNGEKEIPLYYMLCDSEKNCFILSVFGVAPGAIIVGDLVTLMEPVFRAVNVSWKGKVYAFNSIRVDFLGQFLVNGKPLAPNCAAHASLRLRHKP